MEGNLDGVLYAVFRHAFDCLYRRFVGLDGQNQAGALWLAIDDDCACAACSLFAAHVRAREPELVPEQV